MAKIHRVEPEYIIGEYLNALKLPVDEDTFMNDMHEINIELLRKDFSPFMGFRDLPDGKIWSSKADSVLCRMILGGYVDMDETGEERYFKASSRYKERAGYIKEFIEDHEGVVGVEGVGIIQKVIRDFMKKDYGKCYRKPSMEPCELGGLVLDTIFLLRNSSLDIEEQQQVLDALYKCSSIVNRQALKGFSKELLEHYLKPIPKYKPEDK